MNQLQMFALNIRFLIGLLLFLVLLFIVVVGTWTSIRLLLWRLRQRRSQAEERRRKFRPDGLPYPPVAAGICEKCSAAFDEVYHLPDGRRLCAKCYQASPDG